MALTFEKATNYKVMVQSAEAFGILHNGVGKPKLVELLNAKIEEIGEDEFMRRAVIKIDEAGKIVAKDEKPAEDKKEATAPTTSATPVATAGKPASTPATVVTSAKKWYEGVNLPYAEGELVEVTGGILKDRQMQVTRPAPGKVDAMKGHIINAITGALQGTEVTIDLVNLGKAANQTPRLKNTTPAPAPTQTTPTTTIEKTDPIAESPEAPESLKEEKQEQA